MGSLAVNLALPLIGTAMVGRSYDIRWDFLWLVALLSTCTFFVITRQYHLVIERLHPIDCCGRRLDASGKPLPPDQQPMRMKNRLAILLGLAMMSFSVLTVYMAFLMGRELWAGLMLGAMMYAMGGASIGGMVSGWLAGLLDWHSGEPEHDNPIMVAGMSLMASMMGAMPAAMLGGMMALMGLRAIVPTVIVGIALLLSYYFVLFRGQFHFRLVSELPAERALPLSQGERAKARL